MDGLAVAFRSCFAKGTKQPLEAWKTFNFIYKTGPYHLNLRIVTFPIVLYGCETWSLTLREECRLRVFENSVLRRLFGPKRDEVTGEWRKFLNEVLNDLYCLMICIAKWSVLLNDLYCLTICTAKWSVLLNDLFCSLSVVRVIKWGMRWAGYVERSGRGEVYTGILWWNLKERDHLRFLGVDGRIILRWIFEK